MIETLLPIPLSFNFFAVAALVLAAIAIYVFRPRKPLVIFRFDGHMSETTRTHISASMKEMCRANGIRGLLTDGPVTATSCNTSFNCVVNVDARGLGEEKIQSALRKAIATSVGHMESAARKYRTR
jgi:hypothetical protein